MPLIQITKPSVLPVSVDDVKAFSRIDGSEFDSQLAIAVPALVNLAEARTGRLLITRTMELVIDAFPANEIDLLLPNVSSIGTVKYIDSAGVQQTLSPASYALDDASSPCWLLPAYGTSWPACLTTVNAVRIRFDAGYGPTASDVEPDIKLWIIAHAAQSIENPNSFNARDLQPLPWVDEMLNDYCVVRAL